MRAACDTLPQALWHDLMVVALLRTIHESMINTNTQIQKNRTSYSDVGGAGSSEPDPIGLNPGITQDANTTFIGHHHLGRPQELRSHWSVPLGMEISAGGPKSSSSLRSKLWGRF